MNNEYTSDEYLRSEISKYGGLVYKTAYTYCKNTSDTDDIYQEVFLRYFRNKPEFESEEHKKAWLIRVTINCCKTMLSSSWFKKTVSFEEYIDVGNDMPQKSDLFYSVMKLPLKYRRVIYLHYYEGYSIKEIAGLLDIRQTTVGTQLQRGRDILKKEITLKEDD